MLKESDYKHPDTFVPDSCVQVPKGISQTVPSQALQIRDIMERSLRGQILPEIQGNQLQYGEDLPHELADVDELEDRTDVEEYVGYLENRVKAQKEAQERAKSEKAKQSEADKDDA